ncbi:hypothetical protein JL101_032070 (plasmid) [Skermanella rosea]|nr:hypothetical protein [Skermanella rosea]UEM07562.1 hypothetical protein JL101_032070 [Skermanella rosea]
MQKITTAQRLSAWTIPQRGRDRVTLAGGQQVDRPVAFQIDRGEKAFSLM